ncbi:hypothetical protein ACQUW0_26970, partial [Ralstonia pseudosolanacearum]|uniref:hypothetical protein n=1 Tax=Ralstonia pseudosolanacearum TaxID=1310165 RepID=UPI003D170209
MKKTIIIGGTAIPLSASAGALVHYKKQFGTEYTDEHKELKNLKEDAGAQAQKYAEISLRLLWAMARAADRAIEPFETWIATKESAELFSALSEAQTFFASSLRGRNDSSEAGEAFTSERLMAQALICGLSVDDLDDMPLPMALDTIEAW